MKTKSKQYAMMKASLSVSLFLGIFMFSAIPSPAQLNKQYDAENSDQSAVCRRRYRQAQYRADLPAGTNWYYVGTVKRVWLIESDTGNMETHCKQFMIGILDTEVDTESGGRILIRDENGVLTQYWQASPNEKVEKLPLGDKINL